MNRFVRARSRGGLGPKSTFLVAWVLVIASMAFGNSPVLGAAGPLGSPSEQSQTPRELTSLRTADTQTFALANGQLRTDFYAVPLFYQPEGSATWTNNRHAPYELKSQGGPSSREDPGAH